MDSFFDEEKESLVAYYLLPACQLSFKTFGLFFKDAKISRDFRTIRVEMSSGCKEPYWENLFYQTDWTENNITFAIFRIPDIFIKDVELFALGKYSKMSDNLKKRIYRLSGLFYNKRIDNTIVTDKKLLALTKSPILKEWIESTYKVRKGKNSEFIQLKNKDSIFYDK
ncbi:hypothetical protein [Tenacibaculum sp.]|uniref:hypothetical protein n=1 Tax=Tenacibaculum sp. TaxID=1906242 RepID=UPI003D0DBAF4